MTKPPKNLTDKMHSTSETKVSREQLYKTIFVSQTQHNQNIIFDQVHGFSQPIQSQAKSNAGI